MMRGFVSVYRKELYLLFASPIFYAVAFIFLVLNGYFFYSSVAYYNLLSFQAGQNPFMAGQLNLMDMVVRPLFMDICIVLLLVAPWSPCAPTPTRGGRARWSFSSRCR